MRLGSKMEVQMVMTLILTLSRELGSHEGL